MKNYSIDRQNYRIFKSEKSPDSPFVHFFWGKFDFRLSFEINSDDDNNCCHDNFDQNFDNFDDNDDKKY